MVCKYFEKRDISRSDNILDRCFQCYCHKNDPPTMIAGEYLCYRCSDRERESYNNADTTEHCESCPWWPKQIPLCLVIRGMQKAGLEKGTPDWCPFNLSRRDKDCEDLD